MMDEGRMISPENRDENEEIIEKSLRPQRLKQYIGQEKLKHHWKYIEAAQQRQEA